MEYLEVYVDSSYRHKDGLSQTGAMYTEPNTKKVKHYSSNVFICDSNNDAEILGIFLIVQMLYEKYGTTKFRVFNDNIIAVVMMASNKTISDHTLCKHPTLLNIKTYLDLHSITITTEVLSRRHNNIKIVDKLSKVFRKSHEEDVWN